MAAGLSALLFLSACTTSRPAPSPAPPPAPEAAAIPTVRVLVNNFSPLLDVLVAEYQAARPDRRVELIQVPQGVDPTEATRSLKGVDVVPFHSYKWLEKYMPDLTPYLPGGRLDPAPYGAILQNRANPAALYGLPYQVGPRLVQVNLEALQKAGVALPPADWSWEQFRDFLAVLTARNNGRPAMQAAAPEFLAQFYLTQRVDGPLWQATAADLAATFSFFATLVRTDKSLAAPPIRDWRSSMVLTDDGFDSGQAPVGLTAGPGTDVSVNFARGYLPIPGHGPDRRTTRAQVYWLALSPMSENHELAADFIQFAAGEPGALAMARAGFLPAYRSEAVVAVAQSPALRAALAIPVSTAELLTGEGGLDTTLKALANGVMTGQEAVDRATAQFMAEADQVRALQAQRKQP